jgi:phosphomevalonate kinase
LLLQNIFSRLLIIPTISSATEALRRNPFIETALSYALTYISTLINRIIEPASIKIIADNDYYSHSSPDSPKFNDFKVPIWDAHKTGLGSSAALVTSLTAALLVHYLPKELFVLDSENGKKVLHNLAQAAHCAAQGKIGSGFDVATAVYGSCLYRRFSPELLQSRGEPGQHSFSKNLKKLVEEQDATDKWDTEVKPSAVKIPEGLRLVMCDVDCGSQTTGMVKQVLAWRKANVVEADEIWNKLQSCNEQLAKELVRLAGTRTADYTGLKTCIADIRSLIREMSLKAKVPIEPSEQTELLDACSALPGVIGGVVPGAGGYDAAVLIIEDKTEVISRLRDLLSTWKVKTETLNGQGNIGKVRMLGVREDQEGVRREDTSIYHNWLE